MRFEGYAAIFDAPDRGGDVVRRGAFVGAGPVPLLWQHGGQAIGSVDTLEEDARGLRVAGVIDAGEPERLVRAGAVTGLSFGYRARAVGHGAYRELLRVDLAEVSLVVQPMQPMARIVAIE